MSRPKMPLSKLAPLVALAILILTATRTSIRETDDADFVGSQRERIRQAFGLIQGELGGRQTWMVRKDVPIPSSQARMLDLNAHVSKELHLLGSSPPVRITLFLAHSSEARAMAGHHPPNCYPAVGWLEVREPKGLEIQTISGRLLKTQLYSFSRGSQSDGIFVLNGFIVPGIGPVATLGDAAIAMNRAERSRLGLAQYQIVFQGTFEIADIRDMATDILASLPEELYASLEAKSMTEGLDS